MRLAWILSGIAAITVGPVTGCGPSGDQYEPDDTPDDASEIAVGESQTRTFHDTSDVDYAWFEAKAQTAYVISTDLASPNMDSMLTLLDADGERIATNDDYETEDYVGLESQITWTAETSGIVYIEATSWSEAEPGTYYLTLTLNELYDAYEPDGDTAHATEIAAEETQDHSFHDISDKDYLSFQAQAFGLYDISVTVPPGETTDPFLTIVDVDGHQLAYNDDQAAGVPAPALRWFSPVAGTYYILLGCTSPGRYSVTLTDISQFITDMADMLGEVDVVLPDLFEPDDTLDTASTIKLGTPQDRTLHLDVTGIDVDFVRFEALAGEPYTIETTIPEDAATDTILDVLDADGKLLSEIDGGGEGAGDRGAFTPQVQGFYYLRVTAYNRERYGPYTLLLDAPAN